VSTTLNAPASSGQANTPCVAVVGGVCTITGPNETGTWTRTSSGIFNVTATGPAGSVVGGLPAIFLPTTLGVEGFQCGAVSAALQAICVGVTVGNLLQGATVTVRFPLVGGGTAGVVGTVTGPAPPPAAAPASVPLVTLPLLPPPPPPAPPPLLPPPPLIPPAPLGSPFAAAPAPAGVPVVPEAESLPLLLGGLAAVGLWLAVRRRGRR
jgi:hypothetical protein